MKTNITIALDKVVSSKVATSYMLETLFAIAVNCIRLKKTEDDIMIPRNKFAYSIY